MKHSFNSVVWLLLLPFLASCASVQNCRSQPAAVFEHLATNSLRVCDLIGAPDEGIGKQVILEGTYYSDLQYYSYIQDSRCEKGHSIIGVGYKVPDRDASVDIFDKAKFRACPGNSFCPVEAHIVVRGVIVRRTSPGHLGLGQGRPVINIQSVLYVEFHNPSR